MLEFFAKYGLEKEIIAVGVSGGADSLALVIRLYEAGLKVVALTVDHQLRPTSAKEAQYVGEVMRQFGIEHHILVWKGTKPTTAIEEEARQARYNLLNDWCKNHQIKVLAVGHHLRDQAETFLLRLQRGSGLYGLSCMQELTMRDGLIIVRPQLNKIPEELQAYLKDKHIRWVEDESNDCDDFLRVKIRKFLPQLEQSIGLTERRLAETAAILNQSRNYFEEQVNLIIENYVRKWGEHIFSWSPKVYKRLHQEIATRLLIKLIGICADLPYPPEASELLRLHQNLHQDDFKGCTLGGCEILVAQKRIWLLPEVKNIEVMTRSQWNDCLGKAPQYANCDLPYKVRRVLYTEIMG